MKFHSASESKNSIVCFSGMLTYEPNGGANYAGEDNGAYLIPSKMEYFEPVSRKLKANYRERIRWLFTASSFEW